MKPSDVKTKHLVLLGAGHAHLVFLKRLGMDPIPGLKVTLLNPDRCALYSGLLPGVIGGHFSTDDMQINLGPLCQFAGADFMVGAAVNVDAASQQIFFNDRPGITHDLLSVNAGSASKSLKCFGNGIPPIPVKPIRGFVERAAGFDAAYRRGEAVAVVGGGDSAMEEATFLTRFASKVYVIHRRDTLRASKIMQDRALNNEKIEFLWNTEVTDVLGDDKVTGIQIRNRVSGEEKTVDLSGFFLAIGHTPNTGPFAGQLEMDDEGYLITKGKSTKTNIPGVFASGDVQDKEYRQAVTAAGTGCMAALDAERYLQTL